MRPEALNKGDESPHGSSAEQVGRSLERYFNLREAALCRGIHGVHDPFDVAAQNGPSLVAEHHERDCPARKVLLVAEVPVRRQQNIEARCLSRRDKRTVRHSFPTAFNGFDDDGVLEGMPKRSRWGKATR